MAQARGDQIEHLAFPAGQLGEPGLRRGWPGRPAVTGKLITSMGAIPAVGVASWLFPIGHILGLILLGIALWRGRAVPAWAALMSACSQILHFVFAVIVPDHALDGLSWGLTAVGFAVAAVAYVRSPQG